MCDKTCATCIWIAWVAGNPFCWLVEGPLLDTIDPGAPACERYERGAPVVKARAAKT
jgi:hypothetical protein